MGPSKRCVGYWGSILKADCTVSSPYASSLCVHAHLPCHKPKATGPIDHELEPFKTMNQNKLFLYKFIVSGICIES
jgi:hypothetical protein